MKLADEVAITTGGTKGIGLGCSRVFGRHGVGVVIAARNEQTGREAADQLRAAGIDALFVTGQVICPDGGASLGYAARAGTTK